MKDTESQPRYNSLMFNRMQTLYNNTVLLDKNYDQSPSSKDYSALLKSSMLDILADMFIESCKNIEYKYQVELYYKMITEKLTNA